MADLMQVVYISRATFKATPAAGGVEPHVARILQQSRSNNPRQGLGGVLYYGDGHFFQCLEGERADVEALLAKVKKDERHKDFKVVYRADVKERQFSDWSMKYIPASEAVKQLLVKRGYKTFDPYQFDQPTVQHLLKTFRELREEAQARVVGDGAASVTAPSEGKGRMAPYILAGAILVIFAVVIALVVL